MIKLNVKLIDNALKTIAMNIRAQIRDNSRKGVDVNGNPFHKYSTTYAEWKLERVGKNSPVNLMLHGQMMRSIVVNKGSGGYEIKFADASMAERAWWHHTGTGQPKRPFFGVSDANAKRITEKAWPKEVLTK
jgi:hypothetical protein